MIFRKSKKIGLNENALTSFPKFHTRNIFVKQEILRHDKPIHLERFIACEAVINHTKILGAMKLQIQHQNVFALY